MKSHRTQAGHWDASDVQQDEPALPQLAAAVEQGDAQPGILQPEHEVAARFQQADEEMLDEQLDRDEEEMAAHRDEPTEQQEVTTGTEAAAGLSPALLPAQLQPALHMHLAAINRAVGAQEAAAEGAFADEDDEADDLGLAATQSMELSNRVNDLNWAQKGMLPVLQYLNQPLRDAALAVLSSPEYRPELIKWRSSKDMVAYLDDLDDTVSDRMYPQCKDFVNMSSRCMPTARNLTIVTIMQVWETVEVLEYESGGNERKVFMRLRRDLHAAFQGMLSRKGVSNLP